MERTSVNYQSLPLKCKIKNMKPCLSSGQSFDSVYQPEGHSSLSFAKDKGVLKDVITIPHLPI